MNEVPMQPIILDEDGTLRFRANAIVKWLFESGTIDLNRIVDARFPVEDVEQFWQMLGYSVSWYGDLSFVRPETVELADDAANRMLHPEDYAPGGMGNPIGG